MPDPQPKTPSTLPTERLRLADLAHNRERTVALTPDAAQCAAVAEALGIVAVRKLRFAGALIPHGARDWRLEARLGATVVQDCVVTLDPVTTRIDEDVTRHYAADMQIPEAAEIEMPEDDTQEALPAELDLAAVMIEALALALPAYPRSAENDPLDLVVTEPGKAPMTREDMRPFAGLAGLRDTLGDADKS